MPAYGLRRGRCSTLGSKDHAHLLRLAGVEVPLFEPPALEAIFQATNGLPRKVNLLAHYALSAAALANARTVTPEHVQAAVPETA